MQILMNNFDSHTSPHVLVNKLQNDAVQLIAPELAFMIRTFNSDERNIASEFIETVSHPNAL